MIIFSTIFLTCFIISKNKMSENNNQSSQSSKITNKIPRNTSSIVLFNKRVYYHNCMNNDFDSDNHHPEYSTTISSVSNNSNSNTVSFIFFIQNYLQNQNQIVEYNINQTFQDLLLQAQKIFMIIRLQTLLNTNIFLQTKLLLHLYCKIIKATFFILILIKTKIGLILNVLITLP